MKDSLCQQFKDLLLAIRCDSLKEFDWIASFFKNESNLKRTTASFKITDFPYAIYYYGSVTGWTGSGNIGGKTPEKMEFEEFKALTSVIEEDEFSGFENML